MTTEMTALIADGIVITTSITTTIVRVTCTTDTGIIGSPNGVVIAGGIDTGRTIGGRIDTQSPSISRRRCITSRGNRPAYHSSFHWTFGGGSTLPAHSEASNDAAYRRRRSLMPLQSLDVHGGSDDICARFGDLRAPSSVCGGGRSRLAQNFRREHLDRRKGRVDYSAMFATTQINLAQRAYSSHSENALLDPYGSFLF